MSGEIILSREELMLFLNSLTDEMLIDYPLTNSQILTAEYKDHFFELSLHFREEDDDESVPEFPNYNDYTQCFLSAGLISYPNLAEFHKIVESYSRLPQTVAYTPDTNQYYNGFLSNCCLESRQIICVDMVQSELLASLNHKHTRRDLDELKQEIKYHPEYATEFQNRRKKRSRKAATLALQEYRSHIDHCHAVVKVGELSTDKERNDHRFVEAVKKYQNDSHTYCVVLTCDQLLIDACEAYGLASFLFQFPKKIHPSHASPEQLVDLIANLAGVLGVIKVDKTLIYGEYRGKQNIDDYKLRYLSGKIPHSIERDLEISNGLKSLDIKF
ncbi:MAG: hypothetical protein ACTSW1_06700 [Candidatus Hodarchaeales archaeon]